MAAGLGFKTFTTGEVLTAADTNGYLMQGILVFASAAARDAAITSPQEGQACYLKDTNQVLTYSGSAWVAVGGGSPLTTKGDVYGFSTVDARIPIGANDTVLTADSTQSLGLKWATPASGGMTLINTGGTALTGSAVTISSIPATYTNLYLVCSDTYSAGNQSLYIRLNGDNTLANYDSTYYNVVNNTITGDYAQVGGYIGGTGTGSAFDELSSFEINIPRYAATENRRYYFTSRCKITSQRIFGGVIAYSSTTAVSSITIKSDSTFSGGTVFLYGVK
jgi:hypothetical protein